MVLTPFKVLIQKDLKVDVLRNRLRPQRFMSINWELVPKLDVSHFNLHLKEDNYGGDGASVVLEEKRRSRIIYISISGHTIR